MMPASPIRSAAAAFALCGFLAATRVPAADDTAAGVRWSVPKSWTTAPPRQMRVATYALPAAKGAAGGECGVYYFGRGQGGGVEENLARWTRQFEGATPARRGRRTVHGMAVSTVDVSGTYLSPGGPLMESQGRLPNYRLLGAIVETPDGLVFFKATGPEPTMERARGDFDRMIDSIGKTGATV